MSKKEPAAVSEKRARRGLNACITSMPPQLYQVSRPLRRVPHAHCNTKSDTGLTIFSQYSTVQSKSLTPSAPQGLLPQCSLVSYNILEKSPVLHPNHLEYGSRSTLAPSRMEFE